MVYEERDEIFIITAYPLKRFIGGMDMKVKYDKEADAAYIQLSSKQTLKVSYP